LTFFAIDLDQEQEENVQPQPYILNAARQQDSVAIAVIRWNAGM
jgi:hypothetical protein